MGTLILLAASQFEVKTTVPQHHDDVSVLDGAS